MTTIKTSYTQSDPEDFKNILVIKLGALGDFIQALGPMAAIRRNHQNAHITLLTTKSFVALAEKSNYFNDIWIDKRPKWHQISDWISLRKQLNKGRFDRVYDLQNNDRTEFYLQLLSPRPQWVGAARGASHRNTSPQRTAGQAFDGHAQTLSLANIHDVIIDKMDWIKNDISHYDLKSPYALIVPGSAPTRPKKRWPADHYVALCMHLSKNNVQPVLIGTEAERDVTDFIADKCSDSINLTAKTSLFDIICLARNAVMAIGNDTGPMHMIAPTGCQTLVLFSNDSEPKRHAPKGDDVRFIQEMNLEDLPVDKVIDALSFND